MALVAANGDPLSGATQWLCSSAQQGPWRPIVGALRSTYSPDPDDSGLWLACRVKSGKGAALVVAPTKVQHVPGVPPPMASWSVPHSFFAVQRAAAQRHRALHGAAHDVHGIAFLVCSWHVPLGPMLHCGWCTICSSSTCV